VNKARDTAKALDAWADQIVEADSTAAVVAHAKRLAADRRLAKADRQFAHTQIDAVRRAIRRAKARAKRQIK
jgi:hypothetical protein